MGVSFEQLLVFLKLLLVLEDIHRNMFIPGQHILQHELSIILLCTSKEIDLFEGRIHLHMCVISPAIIHPSFLEGQIA
mgnify:CR=1 FL=1